MRGTVDTLGHGAAQHARRQGSVHSHTPRSSKTRIKRQLNRETYNPVHGDEQHHSPSKKACATRAMPHSLTVANHSHVLQQLSMQAHRWSEGSSTGVASACRAAAIDPEVRPRRRSKGAGHTPSSHDGAQHAAQVGPLRRQFFPVCTGFTGRLRQLQPIMGVLYMCAERNLYSSAFIV